MSNRLSLFVIVMISCFLFQSCEKEYAPKPKAYFRILLPEKSYATFEKENCPFSFEIPKYTEIIEDSVYCEEVVRDGCMLNIRFKDLGGTIHLTYHEITPEVDIARLYQNTHKFTYHHTSKADYIEEISVNNEHEIELLLNRVGGDAASPMQFYATDRENHYVNGSLYFNVEPNEDSLKPVIQFVEEDLIHLLKTFNWK